MKVAIVTDSAAGLPPVLAAGRDVHVVPMSLVVRGVPEPEGRRSLGELADDAEITTSAPAPGAFETAIKECLRTHDGVVVLTLAATMSASYAAATVAADAVGDAVRVVDTGTAAGGEALVVLAAAEAARRGGGLDEVEARGRFVSGRARLAATLPSLEHLVRGGRVPGIAGWSAHKLGINPLFEFRSGAVHRLRPALSRAAALDRIVARVRRTRGDGARLRLVAQHVRAHDAAADLLAAASELVEPVFSCVGEFGPVMVVHTGPGVAGLAWWWE
jgi:DegV family protein with EDD domain